MKAFDYNDDNFYFLQKYAKDVAGIHLSDNKKQLIYSRLSKRLRILKLESFTDYCDHLRSDKTGEERSIFINAITTNLTFLFRESHHFDAMRETILPDILSRFPTGGINIWSAGCSAGQEIYTIAITLKAYLAKHSVSQKITIYASDIDTNMLAIAKAGVYTAEQLSSDPLPASVLKWFLKGSGKNEGLLKAKDELKTNVVFRQINLMENWGDLPKMHIIFCRNVMIYFDQPSRIRLIERYRAHLCEQGYLIIGHSEMMPQEMKARFSYLGNTMYQKLGS